MHSSVASFHFFALIMRRTSGGKHQELHHMRFELRDIFGCRVPGDRLTAMNRESAALDTISRPVDTGILRNPRREISDEVGNSSLPPKPFEQRHLSLDLRRLIGAARRGGVSTGFGLLDALFS